MLTRILTLLVLSVTLIACAGLKPSQKTDVRPTMQRGQHTALYTKDGSRLRLVASSPKARVNLVFLPGGPGSDAIYMKGLADILDIQGNIWLLDLPDNGDNVRDGVNYDLWTTYLVRTIEALDNVIIAGHSYGGMAILSAPELNQKVRGVILLNTAPVAPFRAALEEGRKYGLPPLMPIIIRYKHFPSNNAYKEVGIALADYYFMPSYREQGRALFAQGIYNHRPLDWSLQKKGFLERYSAAYTPTVPTLILGGTHDHMTPIYLFKNDPRFQHHAIKQVEIQDAGHVPWVENPHAVKVALETFIAKF